MYLGQGLYLGICGIFSDVFLFQPHFLIWYLVYHLYNVNNLESIIHDHAQL